MCTHTRTYVTGYCPTCGALMKLWGDYTKAANECPQCKSRWLVTTDDEGAPIWRLVHE